MAENRETQRQTKEKSRGRGQVREGGPRQRGGALRPRRGQCGRGHRGEQQQGGVRRGRHREGDGTEH